MKTLITLALLLAASVAHAQSVTNITFSVQVHAVTGAVTNTTQGQIKLDQSTQADIIRINGLVRAYDKYKAAGGPKTLIQWIGTDINDRLLEYAKSHARENDATTAAKLQQLLLENPELLNAADRTQLSTIAAKAP